MGIQRTGSGVQGILLCHQINDFFSKMEHNNYNLKEIEDFLNIIDRTEIRDCCTVEQAFSWVDFIELFKALQLTPAGHVLVS